MEKKMPRPKISGRIAGIQSYEDEESIFEQNIYFEMPVGAILKIFDPDILIKKEMMGKNITITIAAFLPQIEKIPEQKRSVKSDYTSSNNPKWIPMHFEGRIEEFNDTRDRFILNFGAGLMEVDIHAFQSEGFDVGDYVQFDVYRIDLNVLYPDN